MEEIRNKKKIWGRLLLSVLLAAGLISGCGNSAGAEIPAEQTADGSGLEVHFIDVGQADAALVLCDGESTVSYTHLDVYKRQVPAWPAMEERSSLVVSLKSWISPDGVE